MNDSTPEQRLLEQRARDLARPLAEPATDRLDLLTFRLAGETCALATPWIREVFPLSQLAPLPGAPPPAVGITVWRGNLLPVLDVRATLGLPTATLDDLGRVLVLGRDTARFGLLVDEVGDIRRVAPASIRAPAPGVARHTEYMDGVTDDAVIVLSAERLLGLEP